MGFPVAQLVKNLPAMQETQEMQARSLGQEDPLKKGKATHSSILAWTQGQESLGGLPSMGRTESDTTEVMQQQQQQQHPIICCTTVYPSIQSKYRRAIRGSIMLLGIVRPEQ